MRKRVVSLFLALVMVLSVVVSFPLVLSASNGIQEKINTIKSVYPTGSYFTVSGGACPSSNHDVIDGNWCSGCYLPKIPARGGLPSDSSVSHVADTCCGFANYVYYCIYGHNTTSQTQIKNSPVYGDLVYTGSHWFIYLSEDNTNYYVYDANGYNGAKNKVNYNGYYPKSAVTALKVYHATNYDAINGTHTHSYSVLNVVSPTCTAQGYTVYKFSSCGNTYNSNYISAIGHKWNSGEIISSAGCTTQGVKKYTCITCGTTYTEALSANGHTATIDAGNPATCTETGLTEGSHCSVCGAVIIAQEVIPALEHDYEITVNSEPTYVSGANVTYICTYTCSVCGETYVDDYVPASHTWRTAQIITPATYTTYGMGYHQCSVCSKGEVFTIDTLGHDLVTDSKDATCTTAGYVNKSCARCDYIENTVIPATGHSYGDWNCHRSGMYH